MEIENSLFYDNSSGNGHGGAMGLWEGSQDIFNCTIVDNDTPNSPMRGGIHSERNSMNILNSIIYNIFFIPLIPSYSIDLFKIK